ARRARGRHILRRQRHERGSRLAESLTHRSPQRALPQQLPMPRIRSTIKSLARTAAGALAAALLHGCATTYEMEVDAIRNPEPVAEGAESYAIVPRDPNTNTNDLRYKETVGWIKTALSAKGYYEA